ncbi:MAG: formimidoylglutamase [Acidobacteriota bacterium]|nr:formimidoylglutamase [Acidobacteriota bacterium]
MFEIFQNTTRPNQDLFFKKNDVDDARLGEIVLSKIEDYADSEIVILGCPQDEGVRRNEGRTGAALAPDQIRTQFYKLTNFGISVKIFDIGNTTIRETLEETHEIHTQVVKRILKDGKKIIVLGGGNDISYADGRAMAEVFGVENWIGINIDAHFDVRADFPRNSGTPYRQLLEEKLIKPRNLYEFAWQPQVNSPVYFDYLQNLAVNLISLKEIQNSKLKVQNILETQNAKPVEQKNLFFGFDVDSVRASDAPGVSAPSPIGLTAEEFIETAKFAGENRRTRIIEFTETNPNFDIDNRTTKLVAAAIYKFCISQFHKK